MRRYRGTATTTAVATKPIASKLLTIALLMYLLICYLPQPLPQYPIRFDEVEDMVTSYGKKVDEVNAGVQRIEQRMEAAKRADEQMHVFSVISLSNSNHRITIDTRNRVGLAGAVNMIRKTFDKRFSGQALRVGVQSLGDGPLGEHISERMGDILVYSAVAMEQVGR